MPAGKMHIDEVDTNVSLVARLLATQFPQWADLPIEPVHSDGTDNAIYRLGDGLAVRLLLIHWATGQVHKEHEWLPRLAPFLPLAIPIPLAKGEPGAGYPWHWSVYRWMGLIINQNSLQPLNCSTVSNHRGRYADNCPAIQRSFIIFFTITFKPFRVSMTLAATGFGLHPNTTFYFTGNQIVR